MPGPLIVPQFFAQKVGLLPRRPAALYGMTAMLDNTTDRPLMIPLLDLEDRMCRWPIGDPKDKGFGFCGHATAHGKSYCRQHQALAWSAQRVVTRAHKAPEKMARAA